MRFDDTILFLDIDECSHNSDNCSRSSTDCQNFQGGYECKCKSGYKYIQGDKFNCERKHACHVFLVTKKLKCPYITAVTRFIISVTNVRPTVCFPHSLHKDLRSHLEIEHGTSRTEGRTRTNCTSPCSNLTLTSLHFILHYISTNKSYFIYLFIYL